MARSSRKARSTTSHESAARLHQGADRCRAVDAPAGARVVDENAKAVDGHRPRRRPTHLAAGSSRPRRACRRQRSHVLTCTGETLGMVGESGSGKSSVARLVMRLIEADRGHRAASARIDLTRSTQGAAPRAQAHPDDLSGPVRLAQPAPQGRPDRRDGPIAAAPRAEAMRARVICSLWSASMPSRSTAIPHEFSGGQRQRIGIARALALEPECWWPTKPSPRSTSRCRRRC
jgi:peptide/nickel transport system ATP-binding protein